jgi:hypothetical protein
MRIKKHRDTRRASKKLKEFLRDRPFGLSGNQPWENPHNAFPQSDGAVSENDDFDQGEPDWHESVNSDNRSPVGS